MYKYKSSNILIVFLLLLLSSCEKEISIDLNKSNPRFVIEGNISNLVGESKVRITKTLNFDETIAFPAVSGALVTITDTLLNKTDTLTESKTGFYNDSTLFGVEGHTYKLQVRIGTEIYTSLSIIPKPLVLDSLLQIIPKKNDPKPPAGTPGANSVQFQPSYKNITRTDKYIQYVITRNDTLINRITARGLLAATGFFSIPFSIPTKKNDVLIFDIQFIDLTAYEFLNELNTNIGQFSATPSNPTSNFSNGALGFFKAHTSQKIKLIVK